MEPTNDPIIILKRGRATILRQGWCQEGFTDAEGRVCAFGAICDETPLSGVKSASEFLTRALLAGETSVADFNDRPTTKRRDIIKLYDRAITIALVERLLV